MQYHRHQHTRGPSGLGRRNKPQPAVPLRPSGRQECLPPTPRSMSSWNSTALADSGSPSPALDPASRTSPRRAHLDSPHEHAARKSSVDEPLTSLRSDGQTNVMVTAGL